MLKYVIRLPPACCGVWGPLAEADGVSQSLCPVPHQDRVGQRDQEALAVLWRLFLCRQAVIGPELQTAPHHLTLHDHTNKRPQCVAAVNWKKYTAACQKWINLPSWNANWVNLKSNA